MSGYAALPQKADMDHNGCDVRFVPQADVQGYPAHHLGLNAFSLQNSFQALHIESP